MQEGTNQDYKTLLSEVIKKQIVILGPDITLAKARNVKGLTVADDGTVTEITGSPQTITQELIDQFVQLSGMIVKKTMEPLLMYHPDGFEGTPTAVPQPAQTPAQPVAQPMPVATPQTTMPTNTPVQQITQDPATPVTNQTPTDPQPATSAPAATPSLPEDGQFHPEQIDTKTQSIIDEALKNGTPAQ